MMTMMMMMIMKMTIMTMMMMYNTMVLSDDENYENYVGKGSHTFLFRNVGHCLNKGGSLEIPGQI